MPGAQKRRFREAFDVVSELETTVRCRREQLHLLSTLFSQDDEQNVIPSVFLYGHTATGKSLLVTSLLEAQQVPHVVVNCVECYTPRLMFEHILNHLSHTVPAPSNDFASYARCDNMTDFVRLLAQLLNDSYQGAPAYIVLDKVERLRDVNVNILPAFLRLQEMTDYNVSVVLLSELIWEKYRTGTSFIEPLLVHMPDYSKDELLEIMSLDTPEGYTTEFYKNYLNVLLGVFHFACRNLRELKHLAALNFPKYIEPITKEEATADQANRLWKHIEPHLKKALSTVYLREVSSAQWERMQQESGDDSHQADKSKMISSTSRANMELPYYSKFLLIAAYLASYNPMKVDRRFFAKNAGKMSKRSKLANIKHQQGRTSNQLLGPKPFPMDRLMAIFYSVVEGKVVPTANIFSQISSLVSLGLLAQVSSTDVLEAPRYKCLCSLDFIKSVSRSVQFEVIRYLYDFV